MNKTDKWLTEHINGILIGFGLIIIIAMITFVAIVFFKYKDTPVSELPVWAWWLLRGENK